MQVFFVVTLYRSSYIYSIIYYKNEVNGYICTYVTDDCIICVCVNGMVWAVGSVFVAMEAMEVCSRVELGQPLPVFPRQAGS